jgi:cyclase
VKPLVRAGKTLQEVIAAKPSQEWDEKWGKGFLKPDLFITIAYNSLSKDLKPTK